MKKEVILTGDNLNILGRNLISIAEDYHLSIFENFNIFILNNDLDILKEGVEYRNCTFHFLCLNPIDYFQWDANATDTLTLNFINLKNSNHADYILKTILMFHYDKEDFNFVHYRLLADFINFNLLQKNLKINDTQRENFGSELFVPKKIIINNNNTKKLKVDFFVFNNNYNSIGAKVVTSIDDIEVKTTKPNSTLLINKNISFDTISN